MAVKKTTASKAASKKPNAKKAGNASVKLLSATGNAKGANTRRPPNNPDIP